MARGRNQGAPAPRARVELMPLDELLRLGWDGNPKEHDLEGIGESFRRAGFVDPVVVDEGTGRIVAGHGRLEKLRRMRDGGEPPPEGVHAGAGDWLVPVLRGIRFRSEEDAEAYLLGSNRLVEAGGYNKVALARMLERHVDAPSGTGWRPEEMRERIDQARAALDGVGSAEVEAPEEFPEHDAGSKKTHECPNCRFRVVCAE